MSSLHELLRPAVYHRSLSRRLHGSGPSRNTFESAPSTAEPVRRRPAALTRTEALQTQNAWKDFFRGAPSASKDLLLTNRSPVQAEIVHRARTEAQDEQYTYELDALTEELDSLIDARDLWIWIEEHVIKNNSRFVTSPNYPKVVSTCFDRLVRMASPHSALAFIHIIRNLSPQSFVAGCTAQIFYKMIRLRWTEWHDIEGVFQSVKDMVAAGIAVRWDVRQLVEEIRLCLELDEQKAAAQVELVADLSDPVQIKAEIEKRRRFAPGERQACDRLELLLASEDILDPALDQSEPTDRRFAIRSQEDWLSHLKPSLLPISHAGESRARRRREQKQDADFNYWLQSPIGAKQRNTSKE